MAIFPTSPSPKEIELIDAQSAIVTRSESKKKQSRIVSGQLWKLKLVFPPMTRAQIAPIFAFMASLRGGYTDFEISSVHHNVPLGVATGSPKVEGAHSAGDTTIDTDGWTPAVTGILKAGDIIKFANHSKVYMVTADADAFPVTGDSTISIVPPLIENLTDNEDIQVSSVRFTVSSDADLLEWKTNRQGHSSYTLELTESVT